MFDCGFTKENNWFRYRAAAIIVENDCVLLATNDKVDYYYSVGGGVQMGEKAEDVISVGDRVEMLFVEGDALPRRDRFRVCGLFSTSMDEMDKGLALTDIRNVQRLSGWDEQTISGYEITTDDFSRVAEFADELNAALLFDGGYERRTTL